MSDWFLKDARGNELGPLQREVAVDLIRAQPGVFVQASRDRVTWQAVRSTAVQSMVTAEAPDARSAREKQEAERVLFELDRFRELDAHVLFGVPRTASVKDYRHGFLNLAKRFHPGRLPRDASSELVKAHMAVYQHLTEVMQQVEKRLANQVFDTRPSSPPPAPPPGARLPTWQLDVLRLRQGPHQLAAHFSVTRQTAFVFTAHRLMNLTTSSVFFPCLPPLPLGTKLGLTFDFEEARRTITSRGAVAYESAGPDQTLRGFGVRLELATEDRGFMVRESSRLSAPAAR
ncbi:MAG: hypothetical protein JNJ54_22210 [Myxococcaceae bacterium]|nr:hypothetical protein [Myxococcaceae bacterium]